MRKLLFTLVSIFSITNVFADEMSYKSIGENFSYEPNYPQMQFNLPEIENFSIFKKEDNVADEILKIETLEMGEGVIAKSGDIVSLHYKYKLANGRVIDSSYAKGAKFDLYVEDAKEMFKDMIVNKPVGTKSRLTISTNLANEKYSDSKLPPDTIVTIDLKIVEVKKVINLAKI